MKEIQKRKRRNPKNCGHRAVIASDFMNGETGLLPFKQNRSHRHLNASELLWKTTWAQKSDTWWWWWCQRRWSSLCDPKRVTRSLNPGSASTFPSPTNKDRTLFQPCTFTTEYVPLLFKLVHFHDESECVPLLFSLVYFQQIMCHPCSALHIFNPLGWNGRYPDIAPPAILGLCKTVKVPETARMEIAKRQSVECGRLDLRRSMEALEYG